MKTNEKFTLSNADIGLIVDTVREKALKNNADRKEAIRISLALEEVLIKYQEHFGEDFQCNLIQDTRGSRYRIKVRVSSLSFNPFEADDDGDILQNLLSGQGLALQWSYRDGVNTLVYSFKKKRKNEMIIQLVTSIAAAILFYFICYFLPEGIGTFISEDIVGPLYDTFIGLISFISGPLVLLSVMWGVFSVGDVTSLSNVGKKMIFRFLLMMCVCAAIMIAVLLPFYSLSAEGENQFAFSDFYKMILDIIPSNIISPFLEGNTLQVIFIAIIIGIAMLLLSEKTTVAAKFVEQTNYIVQLIMETISKLIPFFVFMSIFQLMQNGGVTALTSSYKMLLTLIVASAIIIAGYVLLVSVHFKVSPKLLAKKMISTFIIAVTTASSSASFSEDVETCEKRLGIDKRVVNIGVPIGQTIFMPGLTIVFYCLALYVAEYFEMEISFSWLVTLAVISMLLAIATPPVPGGGLACYALIIAQMGLPQEALAMFCTLGVVPEFLATATNIATLQMELVELSSGLNMLNTEKLKSENVKE